MKRGKILSGFLVPLLLLNGLAVSANATPVHAAKKQSVIEQVSSEYQISQDLIQQNLNKGYFIDEIRNSLVMAKKSGKSLDEALATVAARAVPEEHVTASVAGPNPAKTEYEASAKKRLETAMAVQPLTATADSSQIDFNQAFDQAPFTITAGQDSFSTLTGTTYVHDADLTLPGRNGLSFTLKRDYDSESAQLYDVDFTANPLKTSFKYDSTLNFMGPGWRMEIPSIEIKSGTSTSYIVHMAGGGSYTADLTNNKLVGYPWKDITVRRDTTSDSGGNGFYLSSTTNNLKYFLDSKGKLLKIKDLYNNTITFTYSTTLVNYLDYTPASTGAANAGYPLTQITNSMGNQMTFSYQPATSTEQQKMVVTSGNRSVTYKFTPRAFQTNTTGQTQTVPLLTEVDDPLGNRTIYNYDHAFEDNAWVQTTGTKASSTRNPYALVTSIVHPTGAKTVFTYPEVPATIISNTTANDIFPVTAVYDQVAKSDGTTETDNRLHVEYNGNMCRLASDGTFQTIVTDDQGRRTTYQYKKDSLSNVPFFKMVTQTDDRGDTVDTTTYTYDETNKYPTPLTTKQMISSKSNTSKTVTLNNSKTYDAYTNVTSATNTLGQTVTNTYDATYHRLTKQLVYLTGNASTAGSQYKQTAYTYINTTGAITQVSATDQNNTLLHKEAYTYDSYGNSTKVDVTDTGGKTITTTKTYDSTNTYLATISAQVTNADGVAATSTKSYVTDPLTGKVTQFTDAKNNKTNYGYDLLGRMTQVSYPDNTSVSLVYDDLHNQIEQDHYAGTNVVERAVHKWDPLGRKIEDGIYANTTDYQTKTKYQYDAYGHKTMTEDAMGNATTYTYDLSNRLTKVTYVPDMSTTTYQYDDVNQTQTITTPDGYVTRTTYDDGGRTILNEVLSASAAQITSSKTYDYAGNVLTSKDANNITTYNYDALSELTSVVTPDNKTTTYTYDMRGNVTQIQDGNWNTTQKTYDEVGGLIQQTKNSSSTSDKYYFDANHNVVRHVDRKGQVTLFEYDVRGQLIKSTAGTDIVSYQYDALGRRTRMTDATGTTQYTYTTDNKVASVQLPDGKTITYTYDANGNRLSMKDPFDQTVYYQYNVKNEVQTVTSGNANNTPDASFAYSAEGNLQSFTLGNGMTSSFTYDDHSRVASLQQKTTDNTLQNNYQHTYDGNSNLTSRTSNSTTDTFTYDSLNRIKKSSQFNETYSYDGAGNRSTMQSDQLVLPVTNTYEYDARNQLKKVTIADGKIVTYVYNGDGLLYQRTENGVTTRYYYDGDLMIAEATVVNGTATLKARYLRDGANKLIARVDANGSKAYYSYNSHGDISELRDANGTLLNSYSYDIWGNPVTATETVSNPFRYAGEMRDGTTTLIYLRARWYDPSQGRFINEDTYEGQMDNPLSLNLFTYVQNNPLTHFDPTGHMEDGDERFIGTSIYDELLYLTSMWEATDDPISRAQIHEAATALRKIGDSGDSYTVIRSKAFIDAPTAEDPFSGDVFNGNPNGRGVDSIDVKTLQYVVIDNVTGDKTVAGFVGKTINYTTDKSGRASVKGLTYNDYAEFMGDDGVCVQLVVDVADPLIWYAAAIDDALTFAVKKDGSIRLTGIQDGFPAREIWVNSGKGYNLLYSYYKGSLLDLGPIKGDTFVFKNYKP